ncbi:N-acylneuraminate cytidylyltransferase [Formosa sp. Hel1_31_208]|uniref:acylneuraminate cytidylyltransferase family protein n=1 Tax=Formosa sp. Hel1_31_208 TaxID=1798225 RepID=UPI000879F3A8|nr:acylneuraminate cytidylyltransferase family protein [Formosa sp. Hel1_31_208]SDR91681.1 N-acylneuraminate cytidylyltransferase [Formosa sp. Hel1_31_208]
MIPLIIIPARGGSKGVPGKNIKPLNATPLIHYTIEAAQEVFDNQYIFLSTDSSEIKSVAEETGLRVPVLRPDYLATDTANSRDVILHAMEQFVRHQGKEPEVIILLQPTSPFRTGTQIKEALALYNESLDMVVSVKETNANPYYVLFEEDEQHFLKKSKASKALRRQDVPKVWELNGAIYVINPKSIKDTSIGDFEKVIKYEMDAYTSIDIDTPLDWQLAELIASNQ